jgi:hypothetical protein
MPMNVSDVALANSAGMKQLRAEWAPPSLRTAWNAQL